MDVLRDGLEPVVRKALDERLGRGQWEPSSPTPLSGRLDSAAILGLMVRHWDLFQHLGPAARSWVHELRAIRNSWAHQQTFDLDDTYRALDTAHRLLRTVGAPEAAALDKQKRSLLRTVGESAPEEQAAVVDAPPPSPAPAPPRELTTHASTPPAPSARVPVRQMLTEALAALGDYTTNVDVVSWVLRNYPATKVGTIRAQIIICTVNHDSRLHYPENKRPRLASDPRYDLFFRTDRGGLERYDVRKHGQWAITDVAGILAVSRVASSHSSAQPGPLPLLANTAPPPATQVADVSTRFDAAMRRVYDRARTECGYTATRFVQMLGEHGGLKTAKLLLDDHTMSEGLTALWERKRLDISMEALILQDEWHSLFTDEERAIARRKLDQLGYVK
jgi:hypothetical protein